MVNKRHMWSYFTAKQECIGLLTRSVQKSYIYAELYKQIEVIITTKRITSTSTHQQNVLFSWSISILTRTRHSTLLDNFAYICLTHYV